MRRTDIVEQIRRKMRDIAPTATTILFGSEARGEACPEIDIDLLILVDGEKMSPEQEEAITLPLKIGKTFGTLFEKRHSGDYDDFAFCDEDPVNDLFPQAEAFVDALGKLIKAA